MHLENRREDKELDQMLGRPTTLIKQPVLLSALIKK